MSDIIVSNQEDHNDSNELKKISDTTNANKVLDSSVPRNQTDFDFEDEAYDLFVADFFFRSPEPGLECEDFHTNNIDASRAASNFPSYENCEETKVQQQNTRYFYRRLHF